MGMNTLPNAGDAVLTSTHGGQVHAGHYTAKEYPKKIYFLRINQHFTILPHYT